MTPSSQLATAIAATSSISHETKPRTGGAYWYRWTCDCGKRGDWCSAPETSRDAALRHAQGHAP